MPLALEKRWHKIPPTKNKPPHGGDGLLLAIDVLANHSDFGIYPDLTQPYSWVSLGDNYSDN